MRNASNGCTAGWCVRTTGETVILALLLSGAACGPSNERPPVQGVADAASRVDAAATSDTGGDAAPDAWSGAQDAMAQPPELDLRVDELSITVRNEQGAWPGRLQQSCEFRNGVPHFTAEFENPSRNPCERITFVGGERGTSLMLPDGGVDTWSAGWSCRKVSSSSAASANVTSSAPYVTTGSGGPVTRVNSQVSIALFAMGAAPPVRVTVTILGCPVRSSP